MAVWTNPRTLPEALELRRLYPGKTLIAGGTDLMVTDLPHRRAMDTVIGLLDVPELRGITATEGGGLRIGATTSFTAIGSNERVLEGYPNLAAAAAVVGGWQIQNRATIGGNVVNASPAGDSLPALLAADAIVELASERGVRTVPYESFMTGYRESVLAPDEILTAVLLPPPPPDAVHAYRKVGTRTSQAISKVVLAFTASKTGGRLTRVRFGVGSVAATPVRLRTTEAVCEGQVPSAALAAQAAAAAEGEVTPIDDVRSTGEYRRHVVGRVVRRILERVGAQ